MARPRPQLPSDMLRESEGRVEVLRAADYRAVMRYFAWGALASGLLTALLAFGISGTLWVLAVIPGSFLVVVMVARWMSRGRVVLDRQTRRLDDGGDTHALDDVTAVLTTRHARELELEESSTVEVRYRLALAFGVDPGELLTGFAAVDAQRLVLLGQHGKEVQVWRAAERLARYLDVPIVDLSTERRSVRQVDALDVSLRERLRQGAEPLLEARERPRGVEELREAGRLVFRWRVSRALTLIPLVFMVVFLAGIGIWFAVDFGPAWLALCALALPVIGLLKVAAEGHGDNELEIAGGTLRYANHFMGGYRRALPIDQLEQIRTTLIEGRPSTLSLISDAQVVSVYMSADKVRWLEGRLCRYLREGE